MLTPLMVASLLTEKNESTSDFQSPSLEADCKEECSSELFVNSRKLASDQNALDFENYNASLPLKDSTEGNNHNLGPPQHSHSALKPEFLLFHESNDYFKYFIVSNEPSTNRVKLVCQTCIKAVTSDERSRKKESSSDVTKFRQLVEKVPLFSWHDWEYLNSSDILENHCYLCNLELSRVLNFPKENIPNELCRSENGRSDEGSITPDAEDKFLRPSPKLLQFSRNGHAGEFYHLMTEIKHQINYLSVQSLSQNKKLSLFCELCDKLIGNTEDAKRHVREKKHLYHFATKSSNIMIAPMMMEDYWIFLKCQSPQGSVHEDFICTLCDVKLSENPFSWEEHFQNMSHIVLKSQYLENMAFNPNSSPRPKSLEKFSDPLLQNGINEKKTSPNFLEHPKSKRSSSQNLEKPTKPPKAPKTLKPSKTFKAPVAPRFRKFNLDKVCFRRIGHVTQFLNLVKILNNKVNWFSFQSLLEWKNLRLTCLLCNQTMQIKGGKVPKTVVNHVEEHENPSDFLVAKSLTPYIPSLNAENWSNIKWIPLEGQNDPLRFVCTLCDARLSELPFKDNSIPASTVVNLWIEHLESPFHIENILEVHDSGLKDESARNYLRSNSKMESSKSQKSNVKEEDKDDLLDSYLNPTVCQQARIIDPNNKDTNCSSSASCSGESEKAYERFYFDFYDAEQSENGALSDEFISRSSSRCDQFFDAMTFYSSSLETPDCQINPETLSSGIINYDPLSCDRFRLSLIPSKENIWNNITSTNSVQNAIFEATPNVNKISNDKITRTSETGSINNAHDAPPLPDLFQDLLDLAFKPNISSSKTEADRISELPLPVNLFQDTFDLDAFQSSKKSQQEFEHLTEELSYQMNYFSIDPQSTSQKMTLICKLCNMSVHVSEAKTHVSSQVHLGILFDKCVGDARENLTDEHWKCLHFSPSSQDFCCTLCNVKLPNDSNVWEAHFFSNAHKTMSEKLQALGRVDTGPQNESKLTVEKNPIRGKNAIHPEIKNTSQSDVPTTKIASWSDIVRKSVVVDETSKASASKPAKTLSNLNSVKIIKDLRFAFKFAKVDKYFSSFLSLSRHDQISLRRNCKFILIDEESKEVFCTACHYFFCIENEKTSLKNMILHFTGPHHKIEAHKYGPAAYFQKNISYISFYDNDTGFCDVCKIYLSDCNPQDINFLLEHFESQVHSNLIRAACNYNDCSQSTKVNNDLVTLFVNRKKYDTRVYSLKSPNLKLK